MSIKLVYFRDGSGKLRATWINKGKTYPYSSERQNTREKRKRERREIVMASIADAILLAQSKWPLLRKGDFLLPGVWEVS